MTMLDQAREGIGFFEELLKHASVLCILLSILGSWCVTQLFKFPIHELVPRARWASWWTRFFCAVVAGVIAFFTWPNEWRLAWALFLGSASPGLHWLTIKAIYWTWPHLRTVISAQRTRSSAHKPPSDATTFDPTFSKKGDSQ
jgi:hypothetical protein